MSIFAEIRAAYADWEPAYPADWSPPQREELDRIQSEYGVLYPDDFVLFQLEECHRTPMGDRAWDNFGWASADLEPMHNLRSIVSDARACGVDAALAPFREDNGDFFCCDRNGGVVIWDHHCGVLDSDSRSRWSSFSEWLKATFDEAE